MAGPFYERIQTDDEYVNRKWFTQKPPYVSPLFYESSRVLVTDRKNQFIDAANSCGIKIANWDCREAYSQAYSKFQSKLGEKAAWGENLAQYRQTFETAVDLLELCIRPTRKIAKTLNGFSKRAFKGAAEYRGKNPKRRREFQRFVGRGDLGSSDRWARPLKECNAAYLQYVYGLKPLLSDLSATLLVLDKPQDFSWDIETFGTQFVDEKVQWSGDSRVKFKGCVKIAGTVTCTNPNLHKAQSLGLTNPVALGYELIPFSFIFDYIYDIGSFLSSFDDMLGLKLTDAYVTRFNKGTWYERFARYPQDNTSGVTSWMQRVPTSTLAAPRPYLKLNLSHWKAIHACSVLASVGLLRNR